MDSGFQVLDSSLCPWNLDSEFQSPRSRIPQAKISRIPESGLPYMGRWRMFFWCRKRIQILVKFSSKIDLGNSFSYLCKFSRHQKIRSCKYRCKIYYCWCKLHWRHREGQKKCIRRYLNHKIQGWMSRMSSTLRASSPIVGRLMLCFSMLTGQDGKLWSSDSSLDVSQGPEEMCLSLEHQNPSKTSEKMGWSRYSFVTHSIDCKPRDWGLARSAYA